MLKTLYSRLTLAMALLFGLLIYFFLSSSERIGRNFQDQTLQELHWQLAEHIVYDLGLSQQASIDQGSIKQAFHMMMILGPAIELYLISPEGELLAYDAPEEKILRKQVDLAPIREFLQADKKHLIYGPDPRSQQNKVFSSAPIIHEETQQLIGYLYIIIGGEDYQSIVDNLSADKSWQLTLLGLFLQCVLAFTLVLLIFYALTTPLHQLSRALAEFQDSDFSQIPKALTQKGRLESREIAELRRHFFALAQKIRVQFKMLKSQDQTRREFIAATSHDLRTPLTGIQAYLETLQLKSQSLSQQEKNNFLQRSLDICQQMAKMIDELFELARLEAQQVRLKKEYCNLPDLISDLMQKLHPLLEHKQLNLEVELANPLPAVEADVGKLNRVLQNLLENAIRYAPQKSSIQLKVLAEDDQVKVAIIDQGPGIPEEDIEKICKPFYQSNLNSKNHGQAGLGLSICQKLLELHNSHLNVKSQKGAWTEFSFVLSATG